MSRALFALIADQGEKVINAMDRAEAKIADGFNRVSSYLFRTGNVGCPEDSPLVETAAPKAKKCCDPFAEDPSKTPSPIPPGLSFARKFDRE